MRAKQKIKFFEELTKKQYLYLEALQNTFWKTRALNDNDIKEEFDKILNSTKAGNELQTSRH